MKLIKFVEPTLHDNGGVIELGKSHRWYIQCGYWDTSGVYHRKRSFEVDKLATVSERRAFAKREITKLKKTYEAEILKGIVANEPTPSVFRAAQEILVIKKTIVRERSYHSYSAAIYSFIEAMSLKTLLVTDITVQHLHTYQERLLRDGKKAKTVNNYSGLLKSLFNDMVKRGWLLVNPFAKTQKLKESRSSKNRAYSSEQITMLRERIKEHPCLLFSVKLMYYCFVRPSEIRGLQVKHFDLKNNQLFIPSEISKNTKSEFVTIPKILCEELKEWIGKKGSNYFLFTTTEGKTPIGRNTLSAHHRKILAHFDFDTEYTFYSWKHTGVVTAYKAGVDIKSIQIQCRHHSLEMTDIYLKSLGLYINKAILNSMPEW